MVEGVLRYSEAFKLQVVEELESGRLASVEEARPHVAQAMEGVQGVGHAGQLRRQPPLG